MRKSKSEYLLSIAGVVATQATCARRQVGCVLINDKGHILSTGYNGVAAGMPHCNDPGKLIAGKHAEYEYPHKCAGANCKSGENLDACEAIHAEQNALLQCRDVFQIQKAYVTTAPCVHCTKLLLNTSCQTIIFKEDYAHSKESERLWKNAGRVWQQFKPQKQLVQLSMPL